MDKGETRIVNGEKIRFIPCQEPVYVPKKKRKSGSWRANRFKRLG